MPPRPMRSTTWKTPRRVPGVRAKGCVIIEVPRLLRGSVRLRYGLLQVLDEIEDEHHLVIRCARLIRLRDERQALAVGVNRVRECVSKPNESGRRPRLRF